MSDSYKEMEEECHGLAEAKKAIERIRSKEDIEMPSVTRRMRELYFNSKGIFADDETVYNWYWNIKADLKKDALSETDSNPRPIQYQIGIDTFKRAKANLTNGEYLACLKFNIDKYCWREKGQDIEDFEKIISYAQEAIEFLKEMNK